MTPVLLDTGCIVALLDRSERHHARCVEVLADLAGPLVTCEAVIAEACYLLRSVPRAPQAVLDNVASGVFGIPIRLADTAAAVRALVSKYRRVPMDLADACLVHLADVVGTGRILTLDDDFDIYRWRRSRPFERLVERVS